MKAFAKNLGFAGAMTAMVTCSLGASAHATCHNSGLGWSDGLATAGVTA